MANSERLRQDSFTGVIEPKVNLVSMTTSPVGTLFSMWYGSRHKDSVDSDTIEDLLLDSTDYLNDKNLKNCEHYVDIATRICQAYPEYAGTTNDYKNVIINIAKLAIRLNVPVTESILFNFEVDKANVAWREQAVRARHDAFWMQTSRTTDLSTIDIAQLRSIELLGGKKAVDIYKKTAQSIRDAYSKLAELGIPMEDIRLQPQMMTHRVYWMTTLRSLIGVIGRRSDWIAQSSLWMPIIAQILKLLNETSLKYVIGEFVGAPKAEITKNENGECVVSYHSMDIENEDRYFGRDKIPVDPLWLAYKGLFMPECTNLKHYDYMKSNFIHMWNDDYLSILKWDRKMPDKIGPYDRPKSWFIKNTVDISGLRLKDNYVKKD